jgi:hypothetical protein
MNGQLLGIGWWFSMPALDNGGTPNLCAWPQTWTVKQTFQTIPSWSIELDVTPGTTCQTGAMTNGFIQETVWPPNPNGPGTAPQGAAIVLLAPNLPKPNTTFTFPTDNQCSGNSYCNSAGTIVWTTGQTYTFRAYAR